jgi:hypothetical protein
MMTDAEYGNEYSEVSSNICMLHTFYTIATKISGTGKSICEIDNVLAHPHTDIKDQYYKQRIKL